MRTDMDDEDLFLHTLSDIEEKLGCGDEYSMLRASALLRQLLLDGSALLHRVNRKYRIRVTFGVCGRARAEARIAQNVNFYSALGAIHVSGSQSHTREEVGLDAFLGAKVLKLRDQVLTVRDLISHSANVLGGVHRAEPKDGDEKARELSEWARLEGDASIRINTLQMRSLIMVVLDALKPLHDRVVQCKSA